MRSRTFSNLSKTVTQQKTKVSWIGEKARLFPIFYPVSHMFDISKMHFNLVIKKCPSFPNKYGSFIIAFYLTSKSPLLDISNIFYTLDLRKTMLKLNQILLINLQGIPSTHEYKFSVYTSQVHSPWVCRLIPHQFPHQKSLLQSFSESVFSLFVFLHIPCSSFSPCFGLYYSLFLGYASF